MPLTPYEGDGLGGHVSLGARPAVLVVDLCAGFTNPAYPPGTDLDGVVASTRQLLGQARGYGLPVIFTTIAFAADGVEGRVWRRKMPALDCLIEGSAAVALDERLGRKGSEPLVVKRAASAFAGTGLAATLVAAGADSLIVTGATTSGCVRASVVDACMAGYPVVVPVECVGDRHAGAHEANLFDMAAKYADVRSLAEVTAMLAATATATAAVAGDATAASSAAAVSVS